MKPPEALLFSDDVMNPTKFLLFYFEFIDSDEAPPLLEQTTCYSEKINGKYSEYIYSRLR